jgi:hypothetical protein
MPYGNPYDPNGVKGQLITIDFEPFTQEVWVHVQVTDARNTVAKLCKAFQISPRRREVADYNNIHSVNTPLRRPTIQLPRPRSGPKTKVDVMADGPPSIKGGYAKYEFVDRPFRVGLTQHKGYDPITMEVPIWFENFRAGEGLAIEEDIRTLERMAGRGLGSVAWENAVRQERAPGPGRGIPGIVKLSTTRGEKVVPLIPANYQDHPINANPPKWVEADPIEWSDSVPDGVFRNPEGNRVRQKGVLTFFQWVTSG